jgi:hypothetical protein
MNEVSCRCHIKDGQGRCFDLTIAQLYVVIEDLFNSDNVLDIEITAKLVDEDCWCLQPNKSHRDVYASISESEKALGVHAIDNCFAVPVKSGASARIAIAEFIERDFIDMDLKRPDSGECQCSADFLDEMIQAFQQYQGRKK